MLVLTRKPQQQIRVGENIVITIVRVQGQAVRVGIDAPRSIRVVRNELPELPDAGTMLTASGTNNAPSAQAAAPCEATQAGEKPGSTTESTPTYRVMAWKLDQKRPGVLAERVAVLRSGGAESVPAGAASRQQEKGRQSSGPAAALAGAR